MLSAQQMPHESSPVVNILLTVNSKYFYAELVHILILFAKNRWQRCITC